MAHPADPMRLTAGKGAAPFDIIRAGHLEITVRDLGRARDFYVGQLGLVVTEQAEGVLYLRGLEESSHHSLALRAGAEPAISHLGFLVADDEHVRQAAHWYRSRGRPVRVTPPEQARGHGFAVQVHDELGYTVEFYSAMDRVESLLQRYDVHRGARIQRLDHFNLHIPDVQKGFDYYSGQLGFRCSEYIEGDPPDDTLYAAWLYRKPNVHDVALTAGSGPRLHHFAFWTPDTDAILGACDLLGASGGSRFIERGPGRHGVSNAFYLYLRDPDGHRVELYTSDYWTGDPTHRPKRWSASDDQRRSFWSHAIPESWYLESSLVTDLDGRLQPISEVGRSELNVPVLPA